MVDTLWRYVVMPIKNMVKIDKKQAAVILEQLDKFVEDSKNLEKDYELSNTDRKAIREERLGVEILIKQLEALEWE